MGIQAILPDYTFSCSGIITRISIRVNAWDGLKRFLFQTWRPQPNGTFSLQHSMEIPSSAIRNGTLVTFLSNLSVMSGDAVGYQLKSDVQYLSAIQFFFDSTATTVRPYYRSTEKTMCHISLCDTADLIRLFGAPFISLEFGNCICGLGMHKKKFYSCFQFQLQL